jgi:hypothetical protein
MSRNIYLLITTAVRTSNPTELILVKIAGTVEPPIQCIPDALPRGVKRPWREVDYSLPSSAAVRNGGAIPHLAHTSSWRQFGEWLLWNLLFSWLVPVYS